MRANENQIQLKNHDGPLVSVIIPTCNRPEYLQDALNSVLTQNFQNFEIIVINDGGDDVSEIVEALNTDDNIRLLTHPQRKDVGAARNTGLKSAKGFYIAYLDDDDIYYPDHLETLVNALENTDFPLAYTDSNRVVMRWITDQYVPVGKQVLYSQDFDREKLLVSNYIPTLNIAHRRDLLEKIGFFDESLEVHEDWDFWIRASIQNDFLHIKKVTAEFRVRIGQQYTKSTKKVSFLNTIKLIHDRYAHLVSSPDTFAAKDRASNALALDIKNDEKQLIIGTYQRRHFYKFSKNFADNKKVLDLNCEDGTGSYLLSETAQSVVASGSDYPQVNQAGSRYIADNLKFLHDFMNTPKADVETLFQLITYYDALKILKKATPDTIGKIKSMLTPDGVFVLSVSSQDAVDPSGSINKNTYFNELRILLEKHFKNVNFWGQKIYPVSGLFAYSSQSSGTSEYLFDCGMNDVDGAGFRAKHPGGIIGVASDAPLAFNPANSFLVDTGASLFEFWETCVSRLKSAYNEKQTHIITLEHEIKDRIQHSKNLESLFADQQQHVKNIEDERTEHQQHIKTLENELKSSRKAIQSAHLDLSEKQTTIDTLHSNINGLNEQICELSANLETRNLRIRSMENQLETVIAEKNLALSNFEAELSVIRHSLAWRIVEGARHRINRIFPESSRRRAAYLKCVSAIKFYLNYGLFAVLKKARRNYRTGRRSDIDVPATLQTKTDGRPNPVLPSIKTEEICPIRSKRIHEPISINTSDIPAVRDKIRFIKQELLNEFHQM